MLIKNNGFLVVSGVTTEKRKKHLEEAFVEQFESSDNEYGEPQFMLAEVDGEQWIMIQDAPGDIDDQVREFAKYCKKHRLHVSGEYKFYGDYDGFVKVDGTNVMSFDIEYYALFCGDDKELVDELRRRGYTVKKNKKEKKQ